MKSKKSLFNAGLLVIMGIAFGALTYAGVFQLKATSRNFYGVTDVPGLCFEREDRESGSFEGGYLCSAAGERVESINDYAMFLHGQVNFAAHVRAYELITVLVVIGSMFTISSFVAAIICWNNRH